MNDMKGQVKRFVVRHTKRNDVERLTYSKANAAKAIGVDVNKLGVLVEMGVIKDLKLGALKIPKEEVQRFVVEGAKSGIDYNKMIQEYLDSKKEMQEA